MKKVFGIILSIFIWCTILVYLIFAFRYCRERQQQETLRYIDIVVTDYDKLQVVSPEIVLGWIADKGFALEGESMENVNTEMLAEAILEHGFIKSAKVYTDMEGVLHIEVSQRKPMMRVAAEDGYDFYISDDDWILPVSQANPEYVPVVTGRFYLPFSSGYLGSIENAVNEEEKKAAKNYLFLTKLINFVKLINSNHFWNSEIVQINVTEQGDVDWKEHEIELVPRVGNHIIAFGTLDNVEEKLNKLMLFYDNVLDYEGWDLYKRINIEYKNQVVCTK